MVKWFHSTMTSLFYLLRRHTNSYVINYFRVTASWLHELYLPTIVSGF